MAQIISISHERNKRLLLQALSMKPAIVIVGTCTDKPWKHGVNHVVG